MCVLCLLQFNGDSTFERVRFIAHCYWYALKHQMPLQSTSLSPSPSLSLVSLLMHSLRSIFILVSPIHTSPCFKSNPTENLSLRSHSIQRTNEPVGKTAIKCQLMVVRRTRHHNRHSVFSDSTVLYRCHTRNLFHFGSFLRLLHLTTMRSGWRFASLQ